MLGDCCFEPRRRRWRARREAESLLESEEMVSACRRTSCVSVLAISSGMAMMFVELLVKLPAANKDFNSILKMSVGCK